MSEGQARQTLETSSLQKYSNMPNADVVLQSSDLIDFYVHRSVLIASSSFIRAMFSLPQPRSGAVPNAPPVVHPSEDAETLDSLVSMLYPVPPEMPSSSDSALALLAAAAKYDMDAVKSSIRVEINRRGSISWTAASRNGELGLPYSGPISNLQESRCCIAVVRRSGTARSRRFSPA